ncbi:hypothetical protein N836_30130 [Leptolyngbya sp. Heron Island J]|uniref:hypothetical protein n=1 Tax=Leptolyngbya sp. Heron Island J TaxID=1385935 RepID=UPI0003B9AEDC|nr:hypothetical protein [Leptolyngbya sp. Heron Island J]ESA38787.1 hypothetical protein N836_30130 [Leptolyngbya sp. Heron Island J]
MPKQIINLTRLVAKIWIDQILATYPENPHQLAFQDADFRSKLMLYVLRRIPNSHIAVNASQEDLLSNKVAQLSLGQQQQIKELIHEGIRYMVPLNVIRHIYQPFDTPGDAANSSIN